MPFLATLNQAAKMVEDHLSLEPQIWDLPPPSPRQWVLAVSNDPARPGIIAFTVIPQGNDSLVHWTFSKTEPCMTAYLQGQNAHLWSYGFLSLKTGQLTQVRNLGIVLAENFLNNRQNYGVQTGRGHSPRFGTCV